MANIKIVSESYNAQIQDEFIGVICEFAPVFILIPPVANLPIGKTYVIKDASNDAAINNITVYTADQTLIDNERYQAIMFNGGAITIINTGSGWSIATTSNVASGEGSGDVTGPGASTNRGIAVFNGITGKIIANSPVVVDTLGNLTTTGTFDGRDVSEDGALLDQTVVAVSSISSSIGVLSSQVISLSTSVATLSTNFVSLSTSVGTFSSQISSLSSSVLSLSASVVSLSTSVATLSTNFVSLSTSVGTFSGQISSLSTSVASISANSPTSDQKAALAGTNGTPAAGNPYVTDSDPRLNSSLPAAFINVLDYGADPTNSTDSLAAFNAALSATSNLDAVMLIIPPGSYRMSDAWVIDRPVHILGSGTRIGEGGSTLVFDTGAGSDGIRVAYADSPSIGGQASIIENLTVACNYVAPAWLANQTNYTAGTSAVRSVTYNGWMYVAISGTHTGATEPTWPTIEGGQVTESGVGNPVTWEARYVAGVKLNAVCTLRNIQATQWACDGFSVYASVGDDPVTNANGFRIYDCTATLCNRWGFYTQGSDANGGVITGCTAYSNGITASIDVGGFCDNSFLGNTYTACVAEANENYAYLVPGAADSNSSAFYGNYAEGGQRISINNKAAWHGDARGVIPYGDAQIITPFRINTLFVENDTNDNGTGTEAYTKIGNIGDLHFLEFLYGPDNKRLILQPNLINGAARTGATGWNYYGTYTGTPWAFTLDTETTYGGGRMWIPRDFLIGTPTTESVIGTAHSFPGKANYYHAGGNLPTANYPYGMFFKEYVPYLNGGFLGYLNLQTGAPGTWAPVAKAMYTRTVTANAVLNNWDWYVGVASTTATRTITLPTMGAEDMDAIEFIIKDESGLAGSPNTIRIQPPGAELLDGTNDYMEISEPWGFVKVIRRGGAWYSQVNSANPVLSAAVASLSGSVATMETSVATLSTNFVSLSTSVGTFSGQISSLSTSVGSLSTSVATLSTNFVSLSTSVGTFAGDISSLSTSVGSLSTSVASLSSSVVTLSTNFVSLSTSVFDIGVTVTSLSTSFVNQAVTVSSLSTSLVSLSSTVVSLSTSVANAAVTVTSLSTSLINYSVTIASISTNLINISTTVTSISTSLVNYALTISSLSTSLVNYAVTISSLSTSIASINVNVANAAITVASLSTSLVSLSTTLVSLSTAYNTNSVTGTGTANQLAYWAAAKSITGSSFLVSQVVVNDSSTATANTIPRYNSSATNIKNTNVVIDDNDSVYGQRARIKSLTGTTYTVTSGDTGMHLLFDNGSAISVTISNAIVEGFQCSWEAGGAGQLTFAAASGAVLVNRQSQFKSAGQNAVGGLSCRSNTSSTAAFVTLYGDTEA